MINLVAAIVVLGMSLALVRAQPPVITNQPASRAVWVGCNVSFTAGVSGAGPFTYQWQLNGTNIPNNIITTVAGNGSYIYSGDGGPATNAGFLGPTGVAIDVSGNIFIADQGDPFPDQSGNRIREVTTNGIVTTVAGNGTNDVSGDGGPAIDAGVAYPFGVIVDGSEDLFIVEEVLCRVREVYANGIITTVAGNGTYNFSGDGGPATNAGLNDPYGEALNASGDLFIADYGNQRIREVDTNGIITTVAGNPNVHVTGDGGPATNAYLAYPFGVAVDASGNLFISETLAYRVRKVDTNGIIETIAGTSTEGYSGDGGPATNADLNYPQSLAVDSSGNLFINDDNTRIREVDSNGIITTVAGTGNYGFSGDGGPATNADISFGGLCVDIYGDIFLADNGRIRKLTNTQGPALAMNNATPGNAGAYQVVVTGPGGSVTSSAASLIVATSPLIYGFTLNADRSLTLSCLSPPGSTNVVLSATSLLPTAAWQPLSTNVAGGDGEWQITDRAAGGPPANFYRFQTH